MTKRVESLSGRFDDASSILLLAPSLEPPDDEGCIDLLTTGDEAERNVLSVTVSETPEARLAVWQRRVGDRFPERAAVLAAPGSTESHTEDAALTESPVTVTTLSDPVDPLGFVSAVSWYLGRWAETAEKTFVCIHSVTALLERLGPREVVRVIAVLNARLASMDATAHYHLDPASLDERTLSEIEALFGVVVENTQGEEWSVTHPETDPPRFRGRAPVPRPVDGEGGRLGQPTLSHSFDTVLDILGAPQRRAVLYYLASIGSERVALDTLVSEVHALAPTVGDANWGESEGRIEISLLHTHLPKLEEFGVIELDRDDRSLRYYANSALEASIEEARRTENV